MTTFSTLREANLARQVEWDPGSHATALSWRINELGGEIGELCNILKKLHRERCGVPGSRATREQLTEELADGVICLDLLAMDMNMEPVVPFMHASDEFRPLTEIGVKLLVKMGLIALFIRDERGASAMMDLLGLLFSIAQGEGIDLDNATAVKFNLTSEKMGLETRMEVE